MKKLITLLLREKKIRRKKWEKMTKIDTGDRLLLPKNPTWSPKRKLI